MDNNAFICKKIAFIENTGIFCEIDGKLISYQDGPESNPLYVNAELRNHLCVYAAKQDEPFLYSDIHKVCFCCIRVINQVFYVGPFSMEKLDRVHLHYFYSHYGVESAYEKPLRKFSFSEIISIIQLITVLFTGKQYSQKSIEQSSSIQKDQQTNLEEDEIYFKMKIDDEEIYHHTYMEERRLLDCVREGRVEDAVESSRNMDTKLGRLSTKEIQHWRNACVVAITLCTRAAIDSGVQPYVAYQISDFFIQKCDDCHDVVKIVKYRDKAVERITEEVKKKLDTHHTSSYVEQCMDYIGKHYREKIYLEDIAETLGVSSTYLSRLFKMETGVRMQDYIIEFRVERAANLLTYSNESLPRIAEYVNFPSQSYFGKMFKKYKQMTPGKYREMHKPREF